MQTLVNEILTKTRLDEQQLVEQIERLATDRGLEVYRETLQQLVGKDFPADQARRYWLEALQVKRRDCRTDCNFRGVRSSLLSYLFRVAGEMRDPRIIEADDLAGYRQASVTDGLTGLYHQTYFKAHLEQLVERLRGKGQSFAVVMLDLDHFKQYNDRCGHLAGDQALRQVAELLQQSVRQADLAARYGGEEFALILHRLNRPQAAMVTERIRQAIEACPFAGQERLDRGNLTISGGIAFYPEDGATGTALLQRADERLYRAKQRRNCIFPLNQDQRRARRRAVQSLVEFHLTGLAQPQPGLSRDLSRTGMALVCGTETPPGTLLEVQFRTPFWPSDQTLRGVVRHTQTDRQGQLVRLGIQFDAGQEAITGLFAEPGN